MREGRVEERIRTIQPATASAWVSLSDIISIGLCHRTSGVPLTDSDCTEAGHSSRKWTFLGPDAIREGRGEHKEASKGETMMDGSGRGVAIKGHTSGEGRVQFAPGSSES